jgi:ankyrin repeat protein
VKNEDALFALCLSECLVDEGSNLACVKFLVEKVNLDPFRKSSVNTTSVHAAITTDNHKVLLYFCQRYPLLLELEKPVHTDDALLISVIKNKKYAFSTFKLLVSQLKKPPKFIDDSDSPNMFMKAIEHSRPKIVRYLFNEYKVSITVNNKSKNEEALLVACYFSNLDMVKLLIEELGYDYKSLHIFHRLKNPEGRCQYKNFQTSAYHTNVMSVAILANKVEIIRYLLKKFPDTLMNANGTGLIPIHSDGEVL